MLGKRQIDLAKAQEEVLKLVLEAGGILKKYFADKSYYTKQKTGVDFTTQADIEVDKFLQERLKKLFPQSNFLTEETAPENYSNLKDTENLWVIDPLDGTINFSRKTPYFAISIALVNRGKPLLGVIYLPITEDIFLAREDKSEATLNGRPIKVSETKKLGESVIGCDWAWDLERRKKVVKWVRDLTPFIRQIKCMGSAASDLASLAAGRIDGYIHSGLKPWDVAAAVLIIQKSEGIITTPKGDRWDIFNPEMLATNGILHQDILKLVNG